MALYQRFCPSPIGILYLLADEEHLLEIKMPPCSVSNTAETKPVKPLMLAEKWLNDYFLGLAPSIVTIPLFPSGTAFQRQVWSKLLEIPYGQTVTYGELAMQIGAENKKSKLSAQAVGQAIGANPICILIPCHRVIGKNGKLTGYSGGIDKKIYLLEHEKSPYKKVL